jgi:hypothetical protein
MKTTFVLTAKAARQALSSVSTAVEADMTRPESETIELVYNDGALLLGANNINRVASVGVEVTEFEGPAFDVRVPFQVLRTFVNNAVDDIVFQYGETGEFSLKSGKFKASCPVRNNLVIDAVGNKTLASVDILLLSGITLDELIKLLGSVSWIVDPKANEIYSPLYLVQSERGVELAGGSPTSYAVRNTGLKLGTDIDFLALPLDFVKVLAKVGEDSGEGISLCVNDAHTLVRLSVGDLMLVSSTSMVKSPPPYYKLIEVSKKTDSAVFALNRDELDRVLAKVLEVATATRKAGVAVELRAEGNYLSIRTTNLANQIEDEIDLVDYIEEPIVTKIDNKMLLDIVRHVESPVVEITVAKAANIVFVKSNDTLYTLATVR